MANRAIEWEGRQHVVGISSTVVIRHMARITIGRRGGKASVVVTLVALQCSVSARQREWGFRVVENRTRPIRCRVASRAIGAEAGRHMVRIIGAVVIGNVAGVACGWCAVEDIVDVTKVARNRGMRTSKRERRVGVIERSAGPVSSAVTDRTIHWEPRSRVIGICSAVIEHNVAGIAIGRSARKHVIHVALRTGYRGVCTREGKRCLRVIKNSIEPVCGAMANGTIERECCLHVIRICS
jgi:hypothetical protein